MFESVPMAKVRVAETACWAAASACRNPDDIPASEALRLYETLERGVRALTAAKTLLARRVKDSEAWRRAGHASAAEHLASISGRSLGTARSERDTSEALEDLPATKNALLDGALSEAQGQIIANAAKANPKAEKRLIGKAKKTNHRGLRDEAAKAKAAGDRDPEAKNKRIHSERRLSLGRSLDGSWGLHANGTVADGAIIGSELDRLIGEIFDRSRTSGTRECRDAYAFDALVEMARRSHRLRTGPSPDPDGDKKRRMAAPQHLALLRLDVAALWRGYAEGDELCEIAGLGPIPVSAAKAILGDAVLKLVLTKGVDVANVTSLTRGPTQAMRYASLWTSPICTVVGCTKTRVEYDRRWGAEYRDTRHTRLDQLDPLCHHHHALHTRQRWALVPGTGDRPMVPPEDPRHPANSPSTSGATGDGPSVPRSGGREGPRPSRDGPGDPGGGSRDRPSRGTSGGQPRARGPSADPRPPAGVEANGSDQPALFTHPAA